MSNDGYIKYQSIWKKQSIEVSATILEGINYYRQQLMLLGMIGKIPNGPSFGNISVRASAISFYITGSNTGSISLLSQEQMALVTSCQIQQNTICFSGLIEASSESISHGAIYQKCPQVNAVIHIHYRPIWQEYLNKLPATNIAVEYGTPELALELMRLLKSSSKEGVVVLAGHPDGIISYAKDLERAYSQLQELNQRIGEKRLNIFGK